jgi:hypothetical protein
LLPDPTDYREPQPDQRLIDREAKPLLTKDQTKLLAFVLKHGRKQASVLLGVQYEELEEMLYEIEHEVMAKDSERMARST